MIGYKTSHLFYIYSRPFHTQKDLKPEASRSLHEPIGKMVHIICIRYARMGWYWNLNLQNEMLIAELHEDLKKVGVKACSFSKPFLGRSLEDLGPLLHEALALDSEDDGIALSILRIYPKAAQVEASTTQIWITIREKEGPSAF